MPAVNGVGEPCAGEPHARFEVAGAGNGARNQVMVAGVAQPTGKPAEHEGPRPYRPAKQPRQPPTLLLVPGGRWQTVTCRPVSAAKPASSIFQARTREPLEPPPSAQISSRSALG